MTTNKYYTKDGNEIDFVVSDPSLNMDDPLDSKKGFKFICIDAYIEGKHVGYLKLSYIPNEAWDQLFKYNILNYVCAFGVECLNPRDPKEVFLSGCPKAPNTPEARIVAATEIMLYEHDHQRQWEHSYFVDNPFVDYIRVVEEWQRQGIARNLYFFGARYMHAQGLKMFASGIQTEAAQATWKHLGKRENCTVKRKRFKKLEGTFKYRKYLWLKEFEDE